MASSVALRRLALAALGPALLACGRDEVTAPSEPVAGAVTVDASAGWAYLSLASGATVAVADPAASTAWDVAFNATNVMLNGGAAGPGGVSGACVCQNAAATDAEVLAMTPASELPDFAAVSAGAIAAAGPFATEALVPAIAGWHAGAGAAATANADAAWLVRLHDETSFAALRVVSLQGATAATPGRVTLEYALQPTAAAPLGAARTLVVDVPASGGVKVSLADGATTASATAWDLRFDGWTLRTNGGVSGPGRTAAAVAPTPFAQITSAATEPRAYRTDGYAGVFAQHPWYRYNLQGDHRVSPTFQVYLLRRGDAVYKVQVTGYYGPAGEVRQIGVRYEQLAS